MTISLSAIGVCYKGGDRADHAVSHSRKAVAQTPSASPRVNGERLREVLIQLKVQMAKSKVIFSSCYKKTSDICEVVRPTPGGAFEKWRWQLIGL